MPNQTERRSHEGCRRERFHSASASQEFADPVARGEDEVVVQVLAAGLHQRVRSQADGSHYTSNGELPLVPGIDAVVRDPGGQIRYTILDDTALGTMAERTVIEVGRSVVLPDTIDPVAVAAAMNPAMSSWVALRRRIDFGAGQRVAILGATGNAGRMAIQVAKRFGASQVIAVGRDTIKLAELPALGADQTCTFEQLAQAADVDVVIDYVWGEAAGPAMVEVLTNRADRARPLTWLEVGAIAGPVTSIPAAALRSARLQIVGSGIGSVPGSRLRRRASEAGRGCRRRCVRHPRQVRASRGGRAGMDGHGWRWRPDCARPLTQFCRRRR